jgi:nicotinamide-nucleotide amidase
LVSGRLSNIAGSSDVLRGCVVSYASEVKFDVLGVTNGPVVSESAAIEMAKGAQRVLGANVGLALTGVAGPADQEGMKPGTLCVGWRYRMGQPSPQCCSCQATVTPCANSA